MCIRDSFINLTKSRLLNYSNSCFSSILIPYFISKIILSYTIENPALNMFKNTGLNNSPSIVYLKNVADWTQKHEKDYTKNNKGDIRNN